MDGRKDGRMDGRKDGRMDGRTGGRTDGRKEGRKDIKEGRRGGIKEGKEGRNTGIQEGRKERNEEGYQGRLSRKEGEGRKERRGRKEGRHAFKAWSADPTSTPRSSESESIGMYLIFSHRRNIPVQKIQAGVVVGRFQYKSRTKDLVRRDIPVPTVIQSPSYYSSTKDSGRSSGRTIPVQNIQSAGIFQYKTFSQQ
jgi:hypothetical protein